ncbi:putative dual-specificity protein phosphatase [Leptomonas seymouri]|uniref:protein-tyrosine-phosphatase n=1 Tax=Leptomonas seymouri TaxID=5684 RepID=A0A0N0P9F6_LEPSE|nr:putative dual-specificity protein phosphatase [Leptomonas seymouri]|eukprot:KPI90667.1 putative dual-specificity protein phosphatase [Leptomonas seymouri]
MAQPVITSKIKGETGSLVASALSTPRLRMSSSQDPLPTTAIGLSAAPDNGPGVSPPPLPPLPNTPKINVEAPLTEAKKKKREKKGRPQNALFSLASTFNGGAPVSANVVDLHNLDAFSSHISCKRSTRTVTEDVPPTQILRFLFLGSVKDAQDSDFLAKHNIRYIINVSQEEYWSVDKRLQIFTFKVDDSATADIASLFTPTRSLINSVRDRYYRSEAAGKTSRPAVLVHCQKGRSRSATIVLAYLIYTNGWSVAEAMRYVVTRRPCAEPNIGFMEELRKLQESLPAEERTKRYSGLCLFMRNLDSQTSEAHVRETFERRVGLVRDVVMLTVPASDPSDAQCSKNREQANGGAARISRVNCGNPEEKCGAAATALSTIGEGVGEGGVAAPPQAAGGEVVRAEANESVDAKSPLSASAATATPGPAMRYVSLCFVFLTCREDIMRGVKHGQLRDILAHLHPAAGKQIKYATGPKLRRLMTEHQSMSSSFSQDGPQFDGQLQRGVDSPSDIHTSDDADSSSNPKRIQAGGYSRP